MRIAVAATLTIASIASVLAQAGPTFDVVSIKRNTGGLGPGNSAPPIQRPDGGFSVKNNPIRPLIARAYPGMDEIVGLPDWATSERYDIAATSTLTTATADDRIAMMRALLADRLQLKVHVEKREQPAYDLILARRDGRLGSGLTRSDIDCSTLTPPPPPQPGQRPDFTKPPPPCTLRFIDQLVQKQRGDKNPLPGDLMEGTTSMEGLTSALRIAAGRAIVNKTGLTGSYTIRLNLDMFALRRPPEVDPPPDAAPTVFTAIQEQLGLKLEPSKALREVLVIDRLERPTPN